MKQVLEEIADIVSKRVADIPPGFDGGEEIGIGASGSATSRIDKLTEDVIVDHVRESDLGLNVLSEEAGFIDLGGEKTLVIDPLDGTANYNSQIPLFSVSLAVGESRMSDVTHGLVRNLANGETYYAERGNGAWLDDSPIRIRPFVMEKSLMLAYIGNETDSTTWKLMDKARRVRSLGCASLEMCHVARGRADCFYFNCLDFSKRMRIVDIAASTLILREAGGEVYDLTGKPLDIEFSLDDRANLFALGDEHARELIM